MIEIGNALLRKESEALLVIINAVLLDRTILRRYNTAEIIEKHPIAVAVVFAAALVAFALA